MEQGNNRMGILPIGQLLLKMSVPMVLSMLVQALYNVVDSVFVARVGQDALNAVSLAFPVQMLLMAFAIGTGVGMNALVSRYLGEKNTDSADRAANTGAFLYLVTAAVFCVLALLFSESFYRLQTNNPQIIAYGTDYLKTCVGCAFAVCGQVYTERLLQATGRTDLAMIPQITGAVFNMIMDPILIFGLFGMPRLEVLGAAIATVCGQCLAFIVGLTLNIKKNQEIHLRLSLIRPHAATIGDIYKTGFPSIVMQCIGSFMNFGINQILIGFTEAATAVFGAYYKLQSFVFLPVFGMTNAVIPIVSFNYGAHSYDRVRETTKISILASVVIMLLGALVFELIPDLLLQIFSPTEEMLEIGIPALRIIAVHFALAGFGIQASSVCQALGRPVYSLIASVCRQLVLLLPIVYLMSLTGQLNLVWVAFPVAELFSALLCAYFLKKTMTDVLV